MSDQDHSSLGVDREELYSRLKEIVPPLAEVYAGARQILSSAPTPGLAYFLAHAAREIANGLPERITGVKSRKESQALARLSARWKEVFPEGVQPGARPSGSPGEVLVPQDIAEQLAAYLKERETRTASRDAVERLFLWLGPGNRYLKQDLGPLIQEWMRIRRWFEANAHSPRGNAGNLLDAREAIENFERFERWLESLLQRFFVARRELDVILDDAGPERLPDLLPLLVSDQQRWHFFNRLAVKSDAAWLQPLREHGFFDHPPPAIAREGDPNTFVHARWPAGTYLARMAAHPAAQHAVAEIALEMLSGNHAIQNWCVQEDLVDVALSLPEASGARLSKKIYAWGGDSFGTVARKLGQLAVRLARAKQVPEALGLMKGLLALRHPTRPGYDRSLFGEPEPEARIRWWALRTVIEEAVPEFIRSTGLEGFALVCGALAKALPREPTAAAIVVRDGSHVWRRSIEGSGAERMSARELLAAAVVRSALQLAEAGTPVKDLLAVLDSRRWEVFQRLAQYLLAQSPSADLDRLRAYLLDRDQFDLFRREYRMLMEAGFGHLASSDQVTVLDWIEAGPDPERLRQHLAFRTGHDPTDEEVERACRSWQWRRLGPLTRYLRPGWQDRQRELNSAFGEPPAVAEPDFWISVGTVGTRAGPVTSEEVASLTVQEIADRYRNWKPLPEALGAVPEGGVALVSGVATDPRRFAAAATCFVGLEPAPVGELFSGLEQAVRDGHRFEWEPVLDLACWTVEQGPVSLGDLDPPSEEAAWEWTRGAMARLLKAGLAHPESAPPLPLAERIWPLIEALQDDPPNNRADAVGAAIRFAHWLNPEKEGELFEHAPQAAAFLEGQLARDRPGAPRVYEEFGTMLSFLAGRAPTWTRANLDRILPPAQDLWDAAWQSHIQGKVPPRAAFEVLQGAYRRAIEQLSPAEPEVVPGVPDDSRLVQECLATHLIFLYGSGALDEVPGGHTLLDAFFARADARLRRYALWTVGRTFTRHKAQNGLEAEVSPAIAQRFQDLWTRRLDRLHADSSVREELAAFGSWFAYGRFEEDWAFDQLEYVLRDPHPVDGEPVLDQHGVVQRLAALVEAAPARVVRILQRLSELTADATWAYGWRDEIRHIIGAAVRSADPDASRAVVDMLDRLGALGLRNVREFVGTSRDLDDPLAIPYFLWDQPLTVAQFRQRLSSASEPERDRLLGLLLREAVDTDVWKFTSPDEVLSRWSRVEKHLGRRRDLWSLLLRKWQEQGLLAR